MLLGGAVSEEELLGSRSTGATIDFQQALELARKIISSGLSSLGVVSTNDLPSGTLHEHMKEIISSQEERVRQLIRSYLPVIERTSRYLIEKERITVITCGSCLEEGKTLFNKSRLVNRFKSAKLLKCTYSDSPYVPGDTISRRLYFSGRGV